LLRFQIAVTVSARGVDERAGEMNMGTRRKSPLNAIVKMETNIANLPRILRDRYGLGENPELRSYLYERLQQLAIQYGEPVYRTIETVAGIAKYARAPDKFFCTVVLRRLKEQNFIEPEGDL